MCLQCVCLQCLSVVCVSVVCVSVVFVCSVCVCSVCLQCVCSVCLQCVSNFIAISSLVVKLLKKCRVRQRVGHPVYTVCWNYNQYLLLGRFEVLSAVLCCCTAHRPAMTIETVSLSIHFNAPCAGIAQSVQRLRYGLDGPGVESRQGRHFPHPSRPALEPTQPPIQWIPRLYGGKAAGTWLWPPTPIQRRG